MTFLARAAGGTFTEKIIEILNNKLHLKCSESAGGLVSVNVLSRAEFKPPFKIIYEFKPVSRSFHGELNTADLRDGLIEDTTFYGKWLVSWGGDFSDYLFKLTVIKDGNPVSYQSTNTWSFNTWYQIEIEVTELQNYYHVKFEVYQVSDNSLLWSQEADFDKSRSESLRLRLFQQAAANTGESYIDNLKVYGYPSREVAIKATVKAGPGYKPYATPTAVSASSANSDDEQTSWDDYITFNLYSRVGQRKTINGAEIIGLSFYIVNAWAESGTMYHEIRRVSDDSVIASVAWDLSEVPNYGSKWVRKDFPSPVYVNEEVRICVRATEQCNIRYKAADVKPNEMLTKYVTKWSDDAASDCAYRIHYGIANKTIDGDLTTYWQPIPRNEPGAWIYWDFESVKWISGFKIYWGSDVAYRPTSYSLYYSQDASSWTKIADYGNDPGEGWKEYTFAAVQARYIKLVINTHGANGTKVYEVEYHEGYEIIKVLDDDIIDFTVVKREGAYPSASLRVYNSNDKYSDVDVIGEVEIRAGYKHMLWLLFRGYIEAPARSYPPPILEIESSKGYAKRLDFREAIGKSYSSQKAGAIVKDLINTYFNGIFTYDHVADGKNLSIDFDEVAVSECLRTLADACGFVFYVDYNKDLHFVDPQDEETESHIAIHKAENIIRVTYRKYDEIINRVTVDGSGTLTSTAEDSISQSSYWLREKTYNDESLTDQSAVDAMAQELLDKYKHPISEIEIMLPEIFTLELFDKVTVTCPDVGLSSQEGVVKEIRYSGGANGLTTRIKLQHKGFTLADIIAEHEKKLMSEV